MKTLSTYIRHGLTFLAGIGGLLLANHLILPGEVQAANDAGAALVEPLTVLGGLAAAGVARLGLAWLGKRFPALAEKVSNGMSGGTVPLVVWGLACTAVGLGLPSCSPAQVDAARAVPVRVCYLGPDGQVCYSSKAGVEVSVDRGGK